MHSPGSAIVPGSITATVPSAAVRSCFHAGTTIGCAPFHRRPRSPAYRLTVIDSRAEAIRSSIHAGIGSPCQA
ncbi:MAG: hypothetical protein EBR71_02135 [Planctomycetes bacterium]|nr:hypothetical protein [Planctomycetota bacterium]